MPVTRSERIRYSTIDKCLKNTKFKWNLDSLLFQVNSKLEEDWLDTVTKEQLYLDVGVMQSKYKAPIETYTEENTSFYEYADASYAIDRTPLSSDDINKLQEASSLLMQIKSFNFSDDILHTLNKLEHCLKMSSVDSDVVHFEEVGQGVYGEAYIPTIKDAILTAKVLKISYRKLGSSQQDLFTVHPYFLKEYQGRWYLFGYSETSKGPRLYAIDRVQGLEHTDNQYIENRFIGSSVYFNQLIGVMVNGSSKPEDIALWISPKMAPFVLSKPIHPSQFRENYDQSGLFIQITVVINSELLATLLSFGQDLKVLYPAHLANQVKETAWKMAEQYNNKE